MTNHTDDVQALQQQATLRKEIEETVARLFAPEDEALQAALAAAKESGLPEIQISPIQGKLLQLLATTIKVRKILEIGSLAGYSGIWLSRALPADGKLITLEIDPKHAEVVRNSFARAGLAGRSEVRVGKALEQLPQLADEAPFDFIFIDADKNNYPHYLDWALQLTRPGGLIVADNTIRQGKAFASVPDNESTAGLVGYNQKVLNNPRLLSVSLPLDDDNTDGFTVSLVLPE